MAPSMQRSEQSAADVAASGAEIDRSERSFETSNSNGKDTDIRPLRKSVSFPKHITDADDEHTMARSSRSRENVRETDSSADETTGILGSERGGSKSYAATTGIGKSSATEGHPNDARRRRPETQSASAQKRADSRPRWKKLMDKYGAVELENKGSVARDHLALGMTSRTTYALGDLTTFKNEHSSPGFAHRYPSPA